MISADEARNKLEIKATHYLDRLEATVDAEVARAIELDVCEFSLTDIPRLAYKETKDQLEAKGYYYIGGTPGRVLKFRF